MKLNSSLFAFALLCSSAIHSANTDPQKTTEQALHLNWLDTSISPSKNFYSYAVGNWQKTTQFLLIIQAGEALILSMKKFKILFTKC